MDRFRFKAASHPGSLVIAVAVGALIAAVSASEALAGPGSTKVSCAVQSNGELTDQNEAADATANDNLDDQPESTGTAVAATNATESEDSSADDDDRDDDENRGSDGADAAAAGDRGDRHQAPGSRAAEEDDTESAAAENRPTLLKEFGYYSDSDRNVNLTTTSLATAPFHGWAVELQSDRVQAHGTTGDEAAAFTTLSFSKEFSELWGVGGGFGTARSLGTDGLIGSIQGHLNLFGATISPSVARNMLASSAQALHANLMETDFGLAFSQEFENGLSVEAGVHRKYLSDGNRSNEVEFSPTYSFDLRGSKLALGYHFSYLTFATNPEHGYWSPRRALSNDLTAAWTFDWLRTYGGLELSAGRDSVREQGLSNVGPGGGFGGSVGTSLGFRLEKGLSVDLNWSMEGSAAWHSVLGGIAIRYVF